MHFDELNIGKNASWGFGGAVEIVRPIGLSDGCYVLRKMDRSGIVFAETFVNENARTSVMMDWPVVMQKYYDDHLLVLRSEFSAYVDG